MFQTILERLARRSIPARLITGVGIAHGVSNNDPESAAFAAAFPYTYTGYMAYQRRNELRETGLQWLQKYSRQLWNPT